MNKTKNKPIRKNKRDNDLQMIEELQGNQVDEGAWADAFSDPPMQAPEKDRLQ